LLEYNTLANRPQARLRLLWPRVIYLRSVVGFTGQTIWSPIS